MSEAKNDVADGGRYIGGYYRNSTEIQTGNDAGNQHVVTPSQRVLNALNRAQAVPWRINPRILQIQQTVLANGDLLGAFPSADPEESPPKNWDAMTSAQITEAKAELAAMHERNRERAIKAESIHRVLEVAKHVANEPAIYFPHALDYRGRMYPLPTELHPQGHESARALLQFPREQPLNDDGWYWLSIAIANAAGQDKLNFDDRIAWVNRNRELILDSGRNPLDGERFWSAPGVDAPWTLLALCHDYDEGASRTSCAVDATCSGIQHLAALSRDLEVARQVNLIAGPRSDLYTAVAQLVSREVTTRVLGGDNQFAPWAGNITRATTKRPVFTLAYGATRTGRRNMLMEHAAPLFKGGGETYRAAYWLADIVEEVARKNLTGPVKLLDYFTLMAKQLARASRAMVWTVPSGARIEQRYVRTAEVRTRCLSGQLSFRVNKPDRTDVRSSGGGASPNVIHSLDASHLAAIINAWDDRPLAAIHDCVGTYANDLGQLARIARATFCQMYSADILGEFHQQQIDQHPDLASEFPKPPARGDWSPESVLQSQYFFS